MNHIFTKQPNGYTESIHKGISALHRVGRDLGPGLGSRDEQLQRLEQELQEAEAVLIGAGAGLSTAAGFQYSGERFHRYFFDFIRRFGIPDMYSGGFWSFPDPETRWAWWARMIYLNRYLDPPKPLYPQLLALLQGKDYFVITTNVDHQFQRAGIDRARLFYTQGDYGLFQDARGQGRTWDNEDWVMLAMEAQGFRRDAQGVFQVPAEGKLSMRLPHDLVPTAPGTRGPVAMNLRSDDSFVEDAGWHAASARYAAFLKSHEKAHVLYWELGVGNNTPVIIKYPFWALTAENPRAVYACCNRSQALCPGSIRDRSLCIDGDLGEVIAALRP